MDKKKVICNAIFLAFAIFAFVGCMLGAGFQGFNYWTEVGELFTESFFIGMSFLCVPIAFIFTMILILVALYALLRSLNVIKENAFDKAFVIIERVAICVMVISLVFIFIGMFHGL